MYRNSDALRLSALVRRKEVKPSELMEAAIAAAQELNPVLNALVSVNYDGGRACARQSDSTGAFAGVPYLVKNLGSAVAGMTTTGGSRFLHRHARPSKDDSEAVRRARKEGMIPFGVTNTPENGSGLTTEPELYGPTRNPWNLEFTAGGSSGGSAAAVAARIVPIADASDGGGSIRMPASVCGLVGLKPSRGRIPLYPRADSLYGGTVLGCLSRTVRDTAAYLDAVSGSYVGDPYTPPTRAESFLQLSSQDPGRLRIGFSTSLPFDVELDHEVNTSVTTTARLLQNMGHDVEPHDLEFDIRAWGEAYSRIAAVQTALRFKMAEAEFGTTLTDDDVEPWTRAAIERGKAIDAVTHEKDIGRIRYAGRELSANLARYDAFLCPIFPHRPFRLGEWEQMREPELGAYLYPFNVSGLPAISVPTHQSQDGLPIGVQLVGRYGDEAVLLQLANSLETEVRWETRQPPIG